MKEKLFILQYKPDGGACPHHLSGKNEPSEWEWGNFEPRPHDISITKDYSLIIAEGDAESIDFDFYGSKSKFVSDRFITLCNDYKVNFRPVPIDIRSQRGVRPKKPYFVFLPADHLAILDREQSQAEVELVDGSDEVMMDRVFPDVPVYQKIEKFITKDIEVPHLFQCIEIFSLVCTETFRDEAVERGLQGLAFVALDERYVYDPWAGW